MGGGDGRAAEMQNSAMLAAMPDFRDVVTEKKTIIGEDGNEIDLFRKTKRCGRNFTLRCSYTWWWDGLHDDTGCRCNPVA